MQPTAQVGRGMLGRPRDIPPPGLQPGRRRQETPGPARRIRQRRSPVLAHRNAGRLAGTQRDPAVALRRQVQPVGSPEPAIGQDLHRPQVAEQAVIPGRDLPHVHAEYRSLAAHQAQHGKRPGVESGERQDGTPGPGQPRYRGPKGRGDLIGVRARLEQVVSASGEAHQVRRHRDRRRNLLAEHVTDQFAADRQVRVLQAGAMARKVPGEPVGPALVADPVAIQIADALGEAIPQGDERLEVAGPRRSSGNRHRPLPRSKPTRALFPRPLGRTRVPILGNPDYRAWTPLGLPTRAHGARKEAVLLLVTGVN